MADADSSSTPLLNAIHHVKNIGDYVRKTARMFGVAESTLRSRLAAPNPIKSRVGHPTTFSQAEESQLADHCKKMAGLGYVYCRWQVIAMAESMATATGNKATPTKDWYYGFVKRFPDICIQKPKKREMCRVRGSSQRNLTIYFQELNDILEKYDFKNQAERVWNVDETGITLDVRPPKVVAAKGEKAFVVTASRSATTTVIAAGSALGETIPPYIIYKGQRLTSDLTTGCLPGTKFAVTPTGWSNSDTFHDFLTNHFIPLVKKPCLLLYDGHSTHITVKLIETARANSDTVYICSSCPHIQAISYSHWMLVYSAPSKLPCHLLATLCNTHKLDGRSHDKTCPPSSLQHTGQL
jgi:hypothetical protein